MEPTVDHRAARSMSSRSIIAAIVGVPDVER